MPIRRLKDKGHEETDLILAGIEKRIYAEYAQAEKDIEEKLQDYLQRFRKKDYLKKKALAAGEITKAEYDRWKLGQIMIGQRWEELRNTIAEDLTNADQLARSTAFEHMPDVYALNHNYGTYQVEKAGLVDTSYVLYDRQTVEKLMMDGEGHFIPRPGRVLSERINTGKVIPWNAKNIQSVMMQGILQGESIAQIASRLQKEGESVLMEDIHGWEQMTAKKAAQTLAEKNRGVAIRNARTMVTGVQNGGRIDSYDRAIGMGIKVKKEWLATLDGRTRHWHRDLDGAIEDNDKPFENDFGKIMYPGDPEAHPANIYNCRCTLIAAVEGFEHDLSDLCERNVNKLGKMTYEEWKEEHESYSDPITKQDQIAAHMKGIYGAEYAHYATLPDKKR